MVTSTTVWPDSGYAVARLGLRQRAQLVEPVQVGAGEGVGLALVEVPPQSDVTVGEREDRLRLGQRAEADRRLAHRPGLYPEARAVAHASSRSSARSATTRVGAVLGQRPGLPGAIDTDDGRKAAGPPGLDTRERVLEHHGVVDAHAERPRAGQEGVGRRLAPQPLAPGHVPVHARLQQVCDPRGLEDLPAVRARRDHSAAQAGVAGGVQVADRARVGVHPVLGDQLQDELVLARAEALHGLGPGRIARGALGQLDSARGEEPAHPIGAGEPVDVLVVLAPRVEGDELLARPFRSGAQELVEHLLPGRRVHLRGLGQHPVEIEEAGGDAVGQAEHGSILADVAAHRLARLLRR